MLDIARIRSDPEAARRSLQDRKADPQVVDVLLALDTTRREAQASADKLKAERNQLGKEIGRRKRAGEDARELLERTGGIAAEVKELDRTMGDAARRSKGLLCELPNMASPCVPVGVDEGANTEVRRWGAPREFDFDPKPHYELCEQLGLIDMVRGAKLTGTGWPLYTGRGARLERALIQLFLDIQTDEHGYREMQTPFVANRETMFGTGQLPKFENDMYRIDADDLFLIPTSEVTLANIYRNEILDHAALPVRIAGYSPCFRREAGSHGKDTRGIQRIHQFNKVELVKVTTPETSAAEHEAMLAEAEAVLQRLGLMYRVLCLSTGDMGFGAAKTYDLEVYAPASKRWFECSSISTCGDFQARRMKLRYRDRDKGVRLCHTLNGSGLATPRVYVALVETFQQADGSLELPEPLHRYMGGAGRIPTA